MAVILAFAAVFAILAVIQGSFSLNAYSATLSPLSWSGTTEKDHRGAVASLSTPCSRIGVDIFKRGGNAADAIIATQFCLGVVAPHVTGLGGGGFAVLRSSTGVYESIDFREAAPGAAYEDMYKDRPQDSLTGGLASGVPGEVRGLEYIHTNYASLPWADLIRPSIDLSRNGFKVANGLGRALARYNTSASFSTNPTWAIDFAPNGTLLGLGDTMTRKRYADLLEVVAERGPDAFHVGPIAEATIKTLKAANGTMVMKDLADYRVIIRDSPQVNYRAFKLTSCGAPSSGPVVLQVMKVVEKYRDFGDLAAINLSTHRLDEAIRFGYGSRTKLGDPAYVEDLDQYQASMLHTSTIEKIQAKISDAHTLPIEAYNPDGLESLETPGTSHAVAADASGMAITLTSTVNLGFGSRIIVPETGLIMNNEMNDFSIPNTTNAFGYIASPANYVQPGKRPLSSITPVIVEFAKNGTLYFLVGAAGGSQIITSTIESLWHVLDQRMTAPEALATPRFHDQLVPNQILFEYTYSNETTAFMKGRAHNITWVSAGSDVHAIRMLPNGTFEAAAEPRIIASGGFAV